jgi:hypothetical protein
MGAIIVVVLHDVLISDTVVFYWLKHLDGVLTMSKGRPNQRSSTAVARANRATAIKFEVKRIRQTEVNLLSSITVLRVLCLLGNDANWPFVVIMSNNGSSFQPYPLIKYEHVQRSCRMRYTTTFPGFLRPNFDPMTTPYIDRLQNNTARRVYRSLSFLSFLLAFGSNDLDDLNPFSHP